MSEDARDDHRPWPYLVICFFALAMPSAPLIQRYVGVGGAIAYVVAIAVITVTLPRVLHAVTTRLTNRAIIGIGILALLGIIALFAVIYPRVNTHEPGKGSDRDDALNVGVEELVHGRYPYHAKTYLGAPISPGPGALIQSIPFWLMGNAAYQNFFWLPAFVAVAAMLLNDVKAAIVVTLLMIALSPTLVGLEVMTGGDYFANSLYVLAATCLVLMSSTTWQYALSGALLGLLLSSRANYIFIVPLLIAFVWRRSGLRVAAACLFAIVFALLAISLPLYLHDPANFGPLAAQNKFEELHSILPHADAVAAATLTLLTLALSLWIFGRSSHWPHAIACCAVVLIYPALLGLVLDCLTKRRLDFAFAGWAASGTAFAMLALAGAAKQHERIEAT